MNRGRINQPRINGPADTAAGIIIPTIDLPIYPDPFASTVTPAPDPFTSTAD